MENILWLQLYLFDLKKLEGWQVATGIRYFSAKEGKTNHFL